MFIFFLALKVKYTLRINYSCHHFVLKNNVALGILGKDMVGSLRI